MFIVEYTSVVECNQDILLKRSKIFKILLLCKDMTAQTCERYRNITMLQNITHYSRYQYLTVFSYEKKSLSSLKILHDLKHYHEIFAKKYIFCDSELWLHQTDINKYIFWPLFIRKNSPEVLDTFSMSCPGCVSFPTEKSSLDLDRTVHL